MHTSRFQFTLPPINPSSNSFGRRNITGFSVSLWPLSSATGFYQTPETSGGVPETNRPLYIIIYLDDMLFMHASKEQLAAMAPLICRLFEALGLMVNMKKSLLTPTQIIEFLGFQISFCALTLSTTREQQEDTTRSTDTPQMPNLTSKGPGNVHRESCGNIQSPSAGSTVLQSPAQGSKLTTDKTSGPPSGVRGDCHRQPDEE